MSKYFRHLPGIFLISILWLIGFSQGAAFDSANVSVLGRLGGRYNAFTIQGNYAYIAENAGMTIVDISNPDKPVRAGNYFLSEVYYQGPIGIAVSGDYAYLADGINGIYIINVANKAVPSLETTYRTPFAANRLVIQGHYAFVADGTSTQILDISTATRPVPVGSINTTSYYLTVQGNTLYVGADSTVNCYDISTISNPVKISSFCGQFLFYQIFANGKYLYTAEGFSGIEMFDINTPSNPVFAGKYQSTNSNSFTYGVWGNATTALMANSSYMHVLDITTVGSPVLVSTYSTRIAFGVAAKDNVAYLIGLYVGLITFDITTASHTFQKGEYLSLHEQWGMTYQDNKVYLADYQNGLKIIDVSTATKPLLVGHVDTKYLAVGVAVQGDSAFIADGDKGLTRVNISTTSHPVITANYDLSDFAYKVAVSGNYAYVANGTYGLQVFDTSTETTLTWVANYNTPGDSQGIAIRDHYVYLADGSPGVQIIDIANPLSPVTTGVYNSPVSARDVVVSGNYAFVADLTGLRIANISNLASPYEVGSYLTGGGTIGIAVNGSIVYVADQNNGLRIFDVTDPTHPLLMGYLRVPAYTVAVNGDYIYLGGGANFWVLKLYPPVPVMNPLPQLKLFKNQALSPAFNLKEYNTDDTAVTFSINTNFLGLTALTGSTVTQSGYGLATAGNNSYYVGSTYTTGSFNSKVKYSTYKIKKLPVIGLRPGQAYDLNLLNYTRNSTVSMIAASYGKTSSVVVSNPALINTSWVNNTVLRITVLSGFTSGSGISVDVVASPNTGPVFGFDQDKERLWVYPNIIQGGTFSAASDTTDFAYQLVGDRAALPGSIYYVANRADLAGTNASGCLALSFNGSSQGVKMTLKRDYFKVYEKNTWYTARMRVFSSATINDLQVLLYHYKGSIPDESHINGAANVLFGVSTVWSWVETPLYTTDTGLGYPQLHFKNGISTSTGNIYIDEVQVIKAAPALMNARTNTRLRYPYGTFSHVSIFGMGWSTTQTYMIATAVPGFSVTNNQLRLNFAGAGTNNQVGGKFTARSQDTAYTVYTPSSQVGYGIGMQVDVTKVSGTFNDYNSIIYYATYGVPTYGSVNVIYTGGQILGAAEFGRLTDGVHVFAGIANQPYQQMQFAVKSGTTGVLGINSVDFIRDMDDPNYGDSVLYP